MRCSYFREARFQVSEFHNHHNPALNLALESRLDIGAGSGVGIGVIGLQNTIFVVSLLSKFDLKIHTDKVLVEVFDKVSMFPLAGGVRSGREFPLRTPPAKIQTGRRPSAEGFGEMAERHLSD